MICRNSFCGLDHPPTMRCEVAARQVMEQAKNAMLVTDAMVVNTSVVNTASNVVVNRNKDRHKKTDERKRYAREWIRAKRREDRA